MKPLIRQVIRKIVYKLKIGDSDSHVQTLLGKPLHKQRYGGKRRMVLIARKDPMAGE